MEYNGVLYDAILVRGTPRFRANKKMVATESVPVEIREVLIQQAQRPKEIAPSPDQLQREPLSFDEVLPTVAPLSTEAGVAPVAPVAPVAAPEQLPLPLSGADFDDEQLSPPPARDNAPFTGFELELMEQLETMKQAAAEKGGLETATLFQLASEMYRRFGIYTVFVGDPPKQGDTHPFHGAVMNRYEHGIAYQAYNRVQARGVLKNIDFEKQALTQRGAKEVYQEHHQEFQERADGRHNNGGFQTFDQRTRVGYGTQSSTATKRHDGDQISEEPTAEPGLFSKTVRPQW